MIVMSIISLIALKFSRKPMIIIWLIVLRFLNVIDVGTVSILNLSVR